jgi:hypothetical protein
MFSSDSVSSESLLCVRDTEYSFGSLQKQGDEKYNNWVRQSILKKK